MEGSTLACTNSKIKRATIFAKACFGHPSPSKRQKSRGNQCLRRPDTSCVRVSASHLCKLDANSVTLPQMTLRRFGCNSRPPLALRTTGAQNYLRLSRTTSPRFAFHGWQRLHPLIHTLYKAGIQNFRFHDLRHTAASYMVMNGMSLYETVTVLGHKDTQTTARYAHLSTEHIASAIEKVMNSVFNI
jgi:hypothetical protein